MLMVDRPSIFSLVGRDRKASKMLQSNQVERISQDYVNEVDYFNIELATLIVSRMQ